MGKLMANPKGPPLFLYYIKSAGYYGVGGWTKIMSGINNCKGSIKCDGGNSTECLGDRGTRKRQ